jgi:hypothetical protein
MTTQVNISHNITGVQDSIDEVIDDLRREMRKRVSRAMSLCEQRAKIYVQKDSDHTGALHSAIKSDSEVGDVMLNFRVFTDSDIAPYAAIIEYGSGQRGARGEEWKHSEHASGSFTPGFPYSSPDISTPSEDNKYQLTGYSDYAGFVGHIEEWMKTKPVAPDSGDLTTSAIAISWEIINKGNLAHPFMRPAWFDTELRVRKAATNAVRNAVR